MKIVNKIVVAAVATATLASPFAKLDAYGYQPDSEGYAYVDSGYSVNGTPLIPLAAVGAAVLIGIILYSGTSNHHHHQGHQ